MNILDSLASFLNPSRKSKGPDEPFSFSTSMDTPRPTKRSNTLRGKARRRERKRVREAQRVTRRNAK